MDFELYRQRSRLDERVQFLDALDGRIDPGVNDMAFDGPDPTDPLGYATFGALLEAYIAPEYAYIEPAAFPEPDVLAERLREVKEMVPLLVQEGLMTVEGYEKYILLMSQEPIPTLIGTETLSTLQNVGVNVEAVPSPLSMGQIIITILVPFGAEAQS